MATGEAFLTGHALELVGALPRRIDTPLVFPSLTDPQRPADVREAFKHALRAAEIEDFRFHDLRHSAASYLAMNGATLAEIAEILGHKTLAMVKRYSHLSQAHTSRVVASMNEKIFGQHDGA
jgi:integrase